MASLVCGSFLLVAYTSDVLLGDGDAGDAGGAAGQAGQAGCGGHSDAGACSSGHADCNQLSSDGCEVNLSSDSKNCGACAKACAIGATCQSGVCVTATDAGPGSCDPFSSTGCQTGWACVAGIPYYSPSDIYCRPAGNTPADGACSPQALCTQGTTCVFEDPYGNGHCRKFCDLSGAPHGCPAGEHCAMIYHPTIGICVQQRSVERGDELNWHLPIVARFRA